MNFSLLRVVPFYFFQLAQLFLLPRSSRQFSREGTHMAIFFLARTYASMSICIDITPHIKKKRKIPYFWCLIFTPPSGFFEVTFIFSFLFASQDEKREKKIKIITNIVTYVQCGLICMYAYFCVRLFVYAHARVCM